MEVRCVRALPQKSGNGVICEQDLVVSKLRNRLQWVRSGSSTFFTVYEKETEEGRVGREGGREWGERGERREGGEGERKRELGDVLRSTKFIGK